MRLITDPERTSTDITAADMIRAVANVFVTAKAMHNPKICAVIAFSLINGSTRTRTRSSFMSASLRSNPIEEWPETVVSEPETDEIVDPTGGESGAGQSVHLIGRVRIGRR